jgi:hypothetical protein
MAITYVYTKDTGDISGSQTITLNAGETIATITQGTITPADANPPVLTLTSGTQATLVFRVSGGTLGVTYGIPLTIKTNQRVMSIMVAVVCNDPSFNPHRNEDPDSYQDLVDNIAAGKSALATAIFQFPADFDPSNGYVVWDLLDSMGVVYSSGNAYEYKILASGVSNNVIAKCIINVPENIPPSVDNPYQLRYTCYVQDKVAYSYENVQVVGFPEMQIGAQDSVEMQGDIATLHLVTENLFKNYTLEIWAGNTLVASMSNNNAEKISQGYFVAGSVDTTKLAVSLIPYKVIWKFWNVPAQTFRESASLYIVNSSIINAIEDVKSKVNKARHTLYGTPDSQFPSTEILKWLRRGMDAFNGAYGVLTAFNMTNALGGIREFWLLYAEKMSIDSQYLLEGEKSFNFQGAAISLDVDRTGFLDSMSSKIQGILDNEVKPFKQNLIMKGYSSGDGSGLNGDGDFSKTSKGALGSVGILITPASLYSGVIPMYPR